MIYVYYKKITMSKKGYKNIKSLLFWTDENNIVVVRVPGGSFGQPC